jgi:hypothetical protein
MRLIPEQTKSVHSSRIVRMQQVIGLGFFLAGLASLAVAATAMGERRRRVRRNRRLYAKRAPIGPPSVRDTTARLLAAEVSRSLQGELLTTPRESLDDALLRIGLPTKEKQLASIPVKGRPASRSRAWVSKNVLVLPFRGL